MAFILAILSLYNQMETRDYIIKEQLTFLQPEAAFLSHSFCFASGLICEFFFLAVLYMFFLFNLKYDLFQIRFLICRGQSLEAQVDVTTFT